MVSCEAWCDAKQEDNSYFHVSRTFRGPSAKIAAENYMAVLVKDARYTSSKDACAGVNFLEEENGEI